MKLVVNTEVCSGHGRCYSLVPEVFEPDDNGYCDPNIADVPPELEARAMIGVNNCPEDAISVAKDGD